MKNITVASIIEAVKNLKETQVRPIFSSVKMNSFTQKRLTIALESKVKVVKNEDLGKFSQENYLSALSGVRLIEDDSVPDNKIVCLDENNNVIHTIDLGKRHER